MDDLISRKAAIDALARMMPRSYTPDGSHPADEEIFRAQEVFADCIEALEILPSAQPATNCSEIPNGSDDTISRQVALDAFGLSEKTRKYGGDHSGYNTRMLYEIQDTLESLPAVQLEQRWIPVKNRLPAVPQCRCLITRDDGRGRATVEEALFSFNRWYGNEWLGDGRNRKFDISTSVIAWAPFPEPYRGGDSE